AAPRADRIRAERSGRRDPPYGRRRRSHVSVRHLADLDACPWASGHLLRDDDRLFEACCGDDPEAADDLLRFDEGAVADARHAYDLTAGLQLVAPVDDVVLELLFPRIP